MAGPVFALMLSLKYGWIILAYYAVWVAFIRVLISVMLLGSRYEISWRYPLLLYYNQIVGAAIKTYVLFRMDQQSWTRQKISSDSSLKPIGSFAMHSIALLIFVSAIGLASSVLDFPQTALRIFF